MGSMKREFKFFTIPQWKQEQEYLRFQHNNGWRFINVTFPGFYHFEKCKPEDVIYQLDYNSEGRACKTGYVKLFQDCGWEYLQDFFGYSYFRKPASEMNGNEEIFCDDSSRLDFMKRVFKGRIIPLIIIFLCVIIPQIFINSHINNIYGKVFTGIYTSIAIVYLVIFLIFTIQVWQYCKTAKK